MKITKIWNEIGWSAFAYNHIELVNFYSPSNDYEGSLARVFTKNGIFEASDCSEKEALRLSLSQAQPEIGLSEITEIVNWLLKF